MAFGTGNATIYDDEFVSFDGILLGSTGRSDDFCEVIVPALT